MDNWSDDFPIKKYTPARVRLNEEMERLNLDNTNKFKPTVAWIQEYYDKANQWLFHGELGECIFKAEPIKSHSSWLGSFSILPHGGKIYTQRVGRHMYFQSMWGDKVFINRENFVSLCRPTITLSTYYAGTEYALFCTLVHEMCHYYTYMYGIAPTQAHGTAFREIGSRVSYRSGNYFTVERLADAEMMQNYELDADIKAKNEHRKELKKARAHYFIVLRGNEVRLINTNSEKVLNTVRSVERRYGSKILEITNPDLTRQLYESGYKSEMRKYSYWGITQNNGLVNKILSDTNNYRVINEF